MELKGFMEARSTNHIQTREIASSATTFEDLLVVPLQVD